VQDEVALMPGKLLLALGSKFEKNTFTGLEVQPSVSLLWNRSDRDTAWISIARAARTPSRVDHDVIFQAFTAPGPDGALILGQVLGNPDIRSEYLVAYEAGYRLKPTPNWSFDLAGFYHVHDGIVTPVEGSPFLRAVSPPVIVVPLVFTNALDARIYGAELAAAWRVTAAASLRLNYSFLRGGVDTAGDVQGPSHQVHARWFWSLPHSLEWDSGYYFTDSYSGVPAYHRVDSRFGWRPHPHWEVSVTAQHLLDDRHREGPAVLALPTDIGRGVYGKIAWTFQNGQ
jgi:iron complex outermembrane receptor protein